MNFDLIIFDCDGVLVDSEVISCRAHAETLTRHGYPITAEQVFERFLGRSTAQAQHEIEAEIGRPLPEDFHPRCRPRLFRLFEADRWQAIAHIGEALDAIASPYASLRAERRRRSRHGLDRAGLYDRFAPHIFSAMQVAAASRRPICFCSPPNR